jgi:hypothetical protein
MNRKDQAETMTHYAAGVDDGFYSGEIRRDDLDTNHPAYKAGFDHGVRLYCETFEGRAA